MTKYEVKYYSNNSGGDWWLKDEDWLTLERDGWTVEWVAEHEDRLLPGMIEDGRWLGALATTAKISVETMTSDLAEGIAISRWRNALSMDPYEDGCSCCGRPHEFYAHEEKE